MCGILGIVSKESILEEEVLIAMRDEMSHRGPDAAGLWISEDNKLALAHRRLAIIDLNKISNQPMKDLSEEILITFNGEIYNYLELKNELLDLGYKFRTSSDTEVILVAYKHWGNRCIEKFNGMFSFCILDRRSKEFFIARDRAGEKPLFYYLDQDTFIFSSELKSIMKKIKSPKINLESLDCLLSFGYIPGELSIQDKVKKLPPAHAMTIELDTLEIKTWEYWSLPANKTIQGSINDSKLLDELECLIEDAVSRQLISDVPVGVLLSGGVDSSLVTAMAARTGKKIKTFTISFPGFSKYNESEHARLISHAFGTDHQELSADNPSPEILYLLAKQFDEPMIDSSMIPTYLVSKLIKKHCTVALGGDGGDELFGGYSTHSRLLWTYSKAKYIPRSIRSLISLFGSTLPYGFKGREWLRSLNYDFSRGLPLVASHFDEKMRRNLFKNIMIGDFSKNFRESRIPEATDLLDRATRMDFKNYLPEDILVKVDRSSMINSLEIRAPLLDHRIIEFAYSKVPSSKKASTFERKILLKNLCKRILPKEFDYHRKQGFSIPLQEWLKEGPWKDFFYEILLGSEVYNKNSIQRLLAFQEKGYQNSERLFGLVMFELWMREYDIDLT